MFSSLPLSQPLIVLAETILWYTASVVVVVDDDGKVGVDIARDQYPIAIAVLFLRIRRTNGELASSSAIPMRLCDPTGLPSC